MIHVSDLIHFNKCKKYCWNCKNAPKEYEGFYHMDEPFSKLWMNYLNIQDCGKGSTGDSNEHTLELLKENDIVCFARFEYKECRTKIPVLVKVQGGYKAIYPHLSAYPKESESLIMKINQQIAEHAGISIVENSILYLNKDYTRENDLILSELLLESDHLFNKRNRQSKSIQECMDKQVFDLDLWIEQVKELVDRESFEIERNKQCTAQRRCIYYQDCFDETMEPDDSILFLTTSRNKLNEYAHGIKRICDLDVSLLEGFRLQYAQYMASKYGIFIDRAAISTWLQDIQYPISYLDFEWDTFAIPPYNGMKVFDVLCFLYSLHVENENHELKHYDFFDTADCREAFIQSLIETLPKTGSILVYNMEGAEKLRLKQLAIQFPKYKEELDAICDRMIDLSKPFECGLFYDNRMRGHYSLKSVLPVFTDSVSYQQLSIQDGLNAVFTYRTFDKSDEEVKRQIRSQLRDYCKMDTFAEYVILHGLQKYCKEEDNA